METISAEPRALQVRLGSIFRQSSVLLAGNLIAIAGGYFFKIFLARTIGAEGLGLFALGESLIGFFLLAVTWQLEQALFRFAGEFRARQEMDRVRRLLWATLFQVIILGILGAGVLILTRNIWAEAVFHTAALAGVLIGFGLMLPGRAFEMVARLFARSYKEVVRVVTITTFVAFPLKIVVTVSLVSLGFGVYGWLSGEILAVYVSAFLLLLLGLRLSPPQLRRPLFTLRQERKIYSFSATMVGRSLLAISNGRLGTLLLGIFLTPTDVGIYGIALTTAALLDTLQSALNGAFAPHISELHATGQHQELARMYYRVTRWDLIAVLPIGIVLIVLAEPMMAIFGKSFSSGALVFSILAVGELVNVGSGPVGTLLTMGGKERSVFSVLILQLAVNALLLFLLLPTLGLVGAAIAFSASTIIIYSVLYLYARRQFPIHLLDRQMFRLLAAALALGVLALVLRNVLVLYLDAIPLLVVVACVVAVVWGGVVFGILMDVQDRALLAETIRGARARLPIKL